jgi:hypothetical protein
MTPGHESLFHDPGLLTAPLWFGYSGWTVAIVANQPEDSIVIALIKIVPAMFAATAGILQVFYSVKIKREKLAVERELRLERLKREFPDPE